MNTRDFATAHLNAFVMYGGIPVRRIEIIRDLRAKGVDEHSIGFFTLKPDVELTTEQAAHAEREWTRLQAIEALVAEGMTWSDAQAVIMAEEVAA